MLNELHHAVGHDPDLWRERALQSPPTWPFPILQERLELAALGSKSNPVRPLGLSWRRAIVRSATRLSHSA